MKMMHRRPPSFTLLATILISVSTTRAAAQPTSGALADVGRATEFEKRTYRFCHDPDFGARGVVGTDLCVILDASTQDVCPTAAEHCAAWVELPARNTFGEYVRRRRNERRPSIYLDFIPPWMRWVLLGSLVIAGIIVLGRQFARAGWKREESDLRAEISSAAARNLQALPDKRSQALLRLARTRLQDRALEETVLLLHLALLRYLDDEGLARYHPSKTNGEYLRAVRHHRSLARVFRRVALQTERIRFGDGRADETQLGPLLEDVGGELSKPRTKNGRSLGASASVAALLLVGAGTTGIGCGGDNPLQPYYDHGPAGLSALPELLESAGLPGTLSQKALLDVPPETRVVVLRTSAAGRTFRPEEMNLDGLLDRSIQVVVLDDLAKASRFLPLTSTVAGGAKPKSMALDLRVSPGDPPCTAPFFRLKHTFHDGRVRIPDGRVLVWDGERHTGAVSSHHLALKPFVVLRQPPPGLRDEHAAAAFAVYRRRAGDEALPGCLYVFSDRDLFTNASLTRPANARWAAGFFAALQGSADREILFAERLDGYGVSGYGNTENPGRALQASNLLPFLIHAMTLLALLYLALGTPFGPLRDPERWEHRAFVEHIEALGRQYARMGDRGLTHAAISLAKYIVTLQRDKVRGGAEHGWQARASELAHRHRLPADDVKMALRLGIEGNSELGAPAPHDPAPASERMLRTLSRLLRAPTEAGPGRETRPPQEEKPWN